MHVPIAHPNLDRLEGLASQEVLEGRGVHAGILCRDEQRVQIIAFLCEIEE